MAAPSVRAVGTSVFGTAGTVTPTMPTHATNDILVMIVASSANASTTPTHSTPSGYTLVGTAENTTGTTRAKITVWYKRATSGSETAQSCTVTPTGSTACHHFAVHSS